MSGSKYANFDYELSIKILNMLKVSKPSVGGGGVRLVGGASYMWRDII